MSRIDKITSRDKVKEPFYSDIYTNLNIHPETGFLAKLTNEAAIKRSVRNLIFTNKGEALFNPNKGSDIRKILFENFSDQTTDMLKTFIEDVINNYETRVNLLDVIVKPFEDKNLYNVTIIFEMVNDSNPISLQITLYRVR